MGRESKLREARKQLKAHGLERPQQELTRKFLGKTESFKDNSERHFFQRMLRAYLKGAEIFKFGRDPETNLPMTFHVAQSIK